MPNDPYAAEGPHDARIEARAIHVSPNELSLTQLAQGLAYVPPSAGQNAPFMKERSATDKLVGGVAASDTFATSALIGAQLSWRQTVCFLRGASCLFSSFCGEKAWPAVLAELGSFSTPQCGA
jgi:hypothetical protein